MNKLLVASILLFMVPPLVFIERNMPGFEWSRSGLLFGSILALFLVLAACWLALSKTRMRGSLDRLALSLTFFWYTSFFFEQIRGYVGWSRVSELASSAIVVVALSVTAALVLLISKAAAVKQFFLYFSIAVTAMPAIGILLHADALFGSSSPTFHQPSPSDLSESNRNFSIKNTKRNVYYVIMDGMTSIGQTKRAERDKLTQLSTHLALNDYFVSFDAKASYNITHLTLGAIFNLDYFDRDQVAGYTNRDGFFPGILKTGSPLMRSLHETGYEFYYTGNTWNMCDSEIPGVHCSNSVTLFERLLNDYYIVMFAHGGMLSSLLTPFTHNADNFNDALLSSMNIPSKVAPSSGKFFFIHSLIPHPPYVTAGCTPIESGNYTGWVGDLYYTALECAAKRVESFANEVREHDPAAIVVFQGDHGPSIKYDWSLLASENSVETIIERFSIFNAIKAPKECQEGLVGDMGNVETITMVIRCIKGQSYSPHDGSIRSFAGYYEHSSRYGFLEEIEWIDGNPVFLDQVRNSVGN